MIELVLPSADFAELRRLLLSDGSEACAVLFTREVSRKDGSKRLLVRDIKVAAPENYVRRGVIEAELTPEFVAGVTKQARRSQSGLVFVHSHPGDAPPVFSEVDDQGEARLAHFLSHRHPSLHAALVISAGGISARQLGTDQHIRVVTLGENRTVLVEPSTDDVSLPHVFDRQIRAFGSAGQAELQRLRVAVVGLGGTGSLVAQQLAHLGVRDWIVIDPDVLELTNLNRVAGALPSDVGSAKVDIAKRLISSINPSAHVVPLQGDITRAKVATALFEADFIFSCTDSHGSRSVIQQIAYQYLIPCIDMGTVIVAEQGRVKKIAGRVQTLSPGYGCFTCSGLLNPTQVRYDMMNAFERQADPYFEGEHEPAPAVISINSTVTSLAVTMFLSMVSGVYSPGRQILFDGVKPSLRSVYTPSGPDCYICSKRGALAQGNDWPLMARQD